MAVTKPIVLSSKLVERNHMQTQRTGATKVHRAPQFYESKAASNSSSHRTSSDPRHGPSFKSSVNDQFEILATEQAHAFQVPKKLTTFARTDANKNSHGDLLEKAKPMSQAQLKAAQLIQSFIQPHRGGKDSLVGQSKLLKTNAERNSFGQKSTQNHLQPKLAYQQFATQDRASS